MADAATIAPRIVFFLSEQADALDALASVFWENGEDAASGRLNRAADLLREPFGDDDGE
jgi:hypothetical protein